MTEAYSPMQGDPELAGLGPRTQLSGDFLVVSQDPVTAKIVRVQPAFVALQSLSVAGSAIIEPAASCACVNNTYYTFNCHMNTFTDCTQSGQGFTGHGFSARS